MLPLGLYTTISAARIGFVVMASSPFAAYGRYSYSAVPVIATAGDGEYVVVQTGRSVGPTYNCEALFVQLYLVVEGGIMAGLQPKFKRPSAVNTKMA